MKLSVSLKNPVGSIEEEATFSSFISTYPKQPDNRKILFKNVCKHATATQSRAVLQFSRMTV